MNDDLAQMNQPQSEYVVAITWREKPISTLLRDRIHDDYISADTREEAERVSCGTPSLLFYLIAVPVHLSWRV
jgi:hypothetical protein